MNILVTGGAGYIGSHTADAIEKSGHAAIIYDNLSAGHRWAVGSKTLIEADLADKLSIQRAIEQYRIEAVIHFAAHAYVGESVADPRKYFQNNVVNTLNLLGVMLDLGVKYIVYSSTCATYGVPEKLPISEEHSQRPVNPYGESKLFIERVLHWYEKAYGLRWVALRYFNAAGASGQLGECHDPETHLIPLAIDAALTRFPLSVFGTDYPTEDGTAVRDYIHVDDLASAHIAALEYLIKKGTSRAFNLGTGQGHSVREVLQTVERVSKMAVPYRAAARRPGDPAVLVADSRAAKELLSWTPQRSSLREIVESAWLWHARSRELRSEAEK
ncbi:MAG TPA: UDP-glucose 4-epimerase GalE [Candidatus Acidoferrum sp.]|nr:UDP-glucose 4-epimerase GalE [Candidatus Acidoferrum sp.]